MILKGLEDLRRNLADRTGLEPATSAVTGQHSNQLNYRSSYFHGIFIRRRAKIIVFYSFHQNFWTAIFPESIHNQRNEKGIIQL
jgi:hypothetical protein